MIRPPGFRGAAFTTAAEGDMRHGDRGAVSAQLGISSRWATVRQVHGADVVTAAEPGRQAEADAVMTQISKLPVAVLTADCGGIVLESDTEVAAVHAGWRGAAAGVVGQAASAMDGARRAALGPTIGSCCYEVGPEVAERFTGHLATTTWGTTSVDLASAIRAQLPGVEWWQADACTRCGEGWFSHRGTATPERQAAIGWLP